MSVEFDMPGLERRLSARMAKRLLRVGLMFQTECRKDLSVGNPAPHNTPAKRGEHPRLRTGNLRSAVALETTDLDRIARERKLRVGIRRNAEYGFFLRQRGWLGVLNTLDRCRDRLAAVLTGATTP